MARGKTVHTIGTVRVDLIPVTGRKPDKDGTERPDYEYYRPNRAKGVAWADVAENDVLAALDWIHERVAYPDYVRRTSVMLGAVLVEGATRLLQLGLDPTREPAGADIDPEWIESFAEAQTEGESAMEDYIRADLDTFLKYQERLLRRKLSGSVKEGVITSEQADAHVAAKLAETRARFGA